MTSSLLTTLTSPNGHPVKQPLLLFTNNEWRSAKSGESIAIVSPINEEEIVKVHAAGAQDVDDSAQTARTTLRGPRSSTGV
ncbi:unnamed protein product [Clonostachys solani]|uniref:Uncharacterized protein n=1 Tax=Clonostachys solani TaxID=160281 RepID=A0A9P0EL25_9HYPO|nr:unnamed protein product [Clonostachys solani]